MPPRARAGRSSSPLLGSHQSAQEVTAIAATQPALFAAASAKKKGKAPKSSPVLFSFKKPSAYSSAASFKAGMRRSDKSGKSKFSLVEAKYQKGDKKGELTGAVYYRGKPRYGKNDIFKQKLQKKLLKERLRWNDELKVYTAKIYNAIQAKLLLEQQKMVSAEDEADLEDTVVDESVFENAKPCELAMFPIEVDGTMMGAVSGPTYPWGDELTEKGFAFKHIVNGQPMQLWLAPLKDVDFDELEAMFTEYGFPTTKYDGVAMGTDDEDDEQDDE